MEIEDEISGRQEGKIKESEVRKGRRGRRTRRGREERPRHGRRAGGGTGRPTSGAAARLLPLAALNADQLPAG